MVERIYSIIGRCGTRVIKLHLGYAFLKWQNIMTIDKNMEFSCIHSKHGLPVHCGLINSHI